jgi:DHA2 family multidrug resistance protein
MLFANMFLLPIFMQELLGFDATQSGFALMPRVAVMMVATPIVGRLYNHVSPRILIAIGVVFVCYGALVLSRLTLQSSQADVIVAISIQGAGFSFLFVPLTTTALAGIPKHLMPDATGLNSLLRQVGASVGLAVFATMLDSYSKHARGALIAHVDPTRAEVQQRIAAIEAGMRSRGMDAISAHAAALRSLAGNVMRQASTLAFEKTFLLAGILFLAVLPLLLFLKTANAPTAASASEAHVEI